MTQTPNDNDGEMWRQLLTEGESMTGHVIHLLGLLPSNPRCKFCRAPFKGIAAPLMRLIGKERSKKNPHFCAGCEKFMIKHLGGAEIELTMLFVDVRGSTAIAEKMRPTEFSQLMNRFYEVAMAVVIKADGAIDKLIGDEVMALFIPGWAGKNHARRAVDVGQDLLRVTGYNDAAGPWIPIGIGVHTGVAWVGAIAGAGGASDFTALGDNVNIAARLASKAASGEVLISETACFAANVDTNNLEKRELELKGKSEAVAVRVMYAK